MNTSHRFAVGVHIMTLLAVSEGPVSSSMIAGSVNTNPAVIRRMLGLLAKAGLTSATMGSGGGTVLAKPAKDVMLLDIYRAVEEPGILTLHANAPNPACEVGKGITAVLGGVIGRAEHAMETVLADVSVLDMVRGVKGAKHSR